MGEERETRGEGRGKPDKLAPTRIGIAVVEHRGRVLVGVRQADQVLAGHAEFPGGKCRPDELPRDCAIRECREETGLKVEPVELLDQIEFEYPHTTVDLHFWLCRLNIDEFGGEEWPEPENGFRWHAGTALTELDFPAANDAVVRLLCRRFSME